MGYKLNIAKRPHTRSWTVTVKGKLGDQDVDKMQEWCQEHDVGRRTSYDQFQFVTKEDAVTFFLKWTS